MFFITEILTPLKSSWGRDSIYSFSFNAQLPYLMNAGSTCLFSSKQIGKGNHYILPAAPVCFCSSWLVTEITCGRQENLSENGFWNRCCSVRIGGRVQSKDGWLKQKRSKAGIRTNFPAVLSSGLLWDLSGEKLLSKSDSHFGCAGGWGMNWRFLKVFFLDLFSCIIGSFFKSMFLICPGGEERLLSL